ncbi:hypothetical protein Pst134EA_028871 [Puccinia striiformis f. sp. tritici]|uniref:hypothetical protein n=1 Tax=Puccinia striiformis f. sp. tritici TaxID=168172 RepID=UPI0020088B57|nr:hypothetical protein Pst134EA_028871 [Puccinia striiformis f. sp. tritici]KAH9446884.1 hypothetical protein Pst134EA_028871 [Puccinia striiformis f. sp. tritici]
MAQPDHQQQQAALAMAQHQQLKHAFDQPAAINDQHNTNLSIKREKSTATLRKKQSQRFTVAHTSNPGPTESAPPLPIALNNPPLRAPSISSTSDSDFNPGTQNHSHSSYMPNPHSTTTTSNFDPASIFGNQFSLGPPPSITRSGTNLSSIGSAAPSPIGSMNMNPTSTNQSGATPDGEDDIIPTAIVIKNIPFSVRREQLLAIIEDLMIPLPYAFNYHFDNGVFRGLAFANFRSASEADAAVAGLNGFDISGRKLRVEYKKVLQAGEKERIEKEKAIKRMRSMQLQKESSLMDQYSSQPALPSSSTHITFGNYSSHEEDYRGLGGMHNHHPIPASMPHRPSQSVLNSGGQQHPFLSLNHDITSAQQAFESFTLSGALESKQSKELDMNDPQTLELYSRVVVFKEDKLRDELSFAKSLSGPQRRIVHQIAKKLGLVHRSEGVGEERFVVVSKLASGGVPRMNRVASSANMGRAASGQQGGMGGIGQGRYENGLSINSSALRMKKSMPDMRVREMSSGVFYPEPSPRDLLGRKSNMTLRDMGNNSNKQGGFSFQQPDELHSVAIVPHHHQQLQQLNSPMSNNNPHQIIRQPKGPEGGAGKGFGSSSTAAQLTPLRSLHQHPSCHDLSAVFGTEDPCRPSENHQLSHS